MADTISFDRDDLANHVAAVSKVRPWAPNEKTPPVLRISPMGDGAVAISSVRAERSVTARVRCDGRLASEIFVPADAFAAAIGKTEHRTSLSPDEGGVIFRSGRLRLRFVADPRSAMQVPAPAAADPIEIDAAVLRSGLGSAVDAALRDATKQPYLGGVYVHDDGDGLAFAAMDGTRIHTRSMDGTRIHTRSILPRETCDLLLSILPEDGPVRIAADGRRMDFAFGAARCFIVSSQLIAGVFPGCTAQFSAPTNRVLRANADDLLADMDLAAAVAHPRDQDVRLDLGEQCIVSAFRPGAEGASPASGEVDLIAQFTGAPLSIGFQMRPIREALAQFADQPIEWRMGDAESATFITSPTAPGLKIMVMPFRLRTLLRRAA